MTSGVATPAPANRAFAPAKVNLFLHVGPLDEDGYHPVVSLMSFADVGDRLTIEAAPDGGPVLDLAVQGPFAADLGDEDPQRNLVWRATDALLKRCGSQAASVRLVLDKGLPVASGLGGGSSDAGAALTLVRDALGLTVGDAGLEALAANLGADGAACLRARPVLAQGRGERLSPAPAMPILPAVLVNPRVSCATRQVYRAFDLAADATAGAHVPDLPERFDTVADVVASLRDCRNDLERPAVGVAPAIESVLACLRSQAETRLARLSGSGATAFALCDSSEDACMLAARIQGLEPRWWVRPCRLGGPWASPGQSRARDHRKPNRTSGVA